MMKIRLWIAAAMLLGVATIPAQAQSAKPPLFINMVTAEAWRGWTGIHFADSEMSAGHHVTMYLNLDGVKLMIPPPKDPKKRPRWITRDALAEFLQQGGNIIVCGACMEQFRLSRSLLLPGMQMDEGDRIETSMFLPFTELLTW
jgi:tRNA 2-thiouridine synthesizing protein D